MTQELNYLRETPSQTAGPYVHIGFTPNFSGIAIYGTDLGREMVTGPVDGKQITIHGAVFDGMGKPMADALVEIWQADAQGNHNEAPNFTGWGRSAGDPETGVFSFETIKPGQVPFPDGRMQAPHVTFWIVARGINLGLHTRMYFADEPEANAVDPVLTRIEHQNRISTLLAQPDGAGGYRFDIRIQGPDETIFFDV